jgi:uncharacterized protein (DUF2267 family)
MEATMSTGLPVFDKTVQETNLWLKGVEMRLGGSRHDAYVALKATLHALRDRLPLEPAFHLADQLPLLLRGMFAERWSSVREPTREHSAEDFLARIEAQLPPGVGFDADAAARAVFQTLRDHVDLGEVDKILAHLPKPIRQLWREEYV